MGFSLDGANPSPSRLTPAFRRKFGESPPARPLHAGGLRRGALVPSINKLGEGWAKGLLLACCMHESRGTQAETTSR